MNTRDDIIRASDVGEYVYCHRAWWLGRVQGVVNANRAALEAGAARHRAHGTRVRRAVWMQRAAWLLIGVAVLAAILLIVMRMLG